MKLALGIFLLMMTLSTFAQDRVGGGGDIHEMRVNEIRHDILDWINKGGAAGLKLPRGMKLEKYVKNMTSVLENKEVVITFVAKDHPSDDELQVQVDGLPKTCRGFLSRKDAKKHILCNEEKFKSTTEAAQYRLIHHEYAGLVGIEKNDGAASDYEVSNQLSGYLKATTVLRLAVKSKLTGVIVNNETRKWSHGYNVITAYPSIVKTLPKGDDHAELTEVFEVHYNNRRGHSQIGRVEIYTSAGDCGYSTYAITDVEQNAYSEAGDILDWNFYHDSDPRAYYLENFSSWSTEDCEDREYQGRWVRSDMHELDLNKEVLQKFIEEKFLDNDQVRRVFTPLCSTSGIPAPHRYDKPQERACITLESLGYLGN